LTMRTVQGTSLGKLDDVGEWPRGAQKTPRGPFSFSALLVTGCQIPGHEGPLHEG
jgi:hypothetical protein